MTFPIELNDRRVPIDANDLAVWRCNDSGSTLVNAGTAGAGANITLATSPAQNIGIQVPGVFGKCIQLPATTGASNTAWAETPAGVVQPSSAITISLWLFVRAYVPTGSLGRVFTKSHNNNTWSSPFYAISFCEQKSATTGSWEHVVRTSGGAAVVNQSTTGAILTLNQWHHVGLTYDSNGGAAKAYLDGILVGTTSTTGNIAYGNNGEWFIGTPRAVGGAFDEQVVGLIEDIRIAQIARPASFFEEVWGQATGQWRND